MNGVTPTAPGDETGQRSLGLTTCTALVIGNMVGSGFFIAPSALARFGTTALIGWAVMAIGAICLGMVFARLARIAPATGGPYAYTRMGFGRFAGFLVAWGYWISIWASLPAMAAALVGYLAALVPGLVDHRILAIGIALGAMWGVALVNLRGVKEAGLFQVATTFTKLVPFISIAVLGLFWVDWHSFETLNPSGQPFFSALAATAPLTMFAFLGIESATVPAGDVIDPRRTPGTSALVAFYDLIVNLSTDAAMVPYVFCSVVEAVLYVNRRPVSRALRIGPFMPVAIVAFVFSMGTIYGAGAGAGMWSLILILLAGPVWVFLRSAASVPGGTLSEADPN